MNAQPAFSSVLAEHSALEELFRKHQRALLTRDLEGALATLKTIENALGRHISFEDEVLLPLYASKGVEVAGGTLPILISNFEIDDRYIPVRPVVQRTFPLLSLGLNILDASFREGLPS